MLIGFIRDETGATAIEYGLIVSMFAVAIMGSFALLEEEYVSIYASIEAAVVSASATP